MIRARRLGAHDSTEPRTTTSSEAVDAITPSSDDPTNAAIATASHPITDAKEFFNPNVVKVTTDIDGYAHYFSRAPIPYARDAFALDQTTLPKNFMAQRHLGIYAYRAAFLQRYAGLAPAPTEQTEALEQLRAMYHGYRIAVLNWTGAVAPGVDTAADLARVRKLVG